MVCVTEPVEVSNTKHGKAQGLPRSSSAKTETAEKTDTHRSSFGRCSSV